MTTRRLIWPDGTMTSGHDWWDVEDALRKEQRWEKYPDVLEFREEMAARANVWSGAVLTDGELHGSAYQFLRALERAGMMRMEVER